MVAALHVVAVLGITATPGKLVLFKTATYWQIIRNNSKAVITQYGVQVRNVLQIRVGRDELKFQLI